MKLFRGIAFLIRLAIAVIVALGIMLDLALSKMFFDHRIDLRDISIELRALKGWVKNELH